MGYVDEVLDIVSKKNADQPEFLQAVTEVLESLRPVVEANEEVYMNKLAIAGGVASNTAIRAAFEQKCKEENIEFYHPSPILCTDNAVMIGSAAYYEYINGKRDGWDLNAIPNLKLGER